MSIVNGNVVVSLLGRDKGKLYVVCQVDGNYVYVADGYNKTLNNPKKKNIKHIKSIGININHLHNSKDCDIIYQLKCASRHFKEEC